eukprot:scaffold15306_cov34-Isochrysis_galbana.AAC.1
MAGGMGLGMSGGDGVGGEQYAALLAPLVVIGLSAAAAAAFERARARRAASDDDPHAQAHRLTSQTAASVRTQIAAPPRALPTHHGQ